MAYDLKVFFTVVGKPPWRVRSVDVLAFMTAQRTGGDGRLQLAGAGPGGVTGRTLPQILDPGQVDALTAALRTHRDRAIVAAMVLGGLRRCEVPYLDAERLAGAATDLVFTVLKGPRRVLPLTAAGLDEILDGGRLGSGGWRCVTSFTWYCS